MSDSEALKNTQAGIAAVPWLQDPNTRALNETLGETKDRLIDRVCDAVKMRWPSGPGMREVEAAIGARRPAPTAVGDPERLRHLGSTFQLPRLGSMTDAQYDAYLETAWDVHGLGGTVAGIVSALNAFGIPDVDVVEEWMPGAWPGWCGQFNSRRFAVILGPRFGDLGWKPLTFPFPLDGSVALGIAGASQAQLDDVASIIRRVKSADSLPIGVVFRFGNAPVFGSAGLTFPFVLGGSLGSASGAMTIVQTILTAEGVGFPFFFAHEYERGIRP